MTAFLKQVAKDLKLRFEDDISNIAIVFNNKRPIVFLKKYLGELYGKTMLAPSMFTIQEFFSLSSDKAIASDLSRFFILLESYNQLLEEEGIAAESPDSFYAMAQIILSDFDQIDYELADAQAIYTYLKDWDELKLQFSEFTEEQENFLKEFWSSFSHDKQIAVQQKFIELWQRLPKLYRLFHDKIKEQDLNYMALAYRNLAEGNVDDTALLADFKQVVFVGFNALNRCESTLFKKWQDEGKALFYFDADDYYLNDEYQEAGLFIRKNIKKYHLKNALGDFPSLINNSEKLMIIYPVSGNTVQAKALSEWLKKHETDRESEPDKTAVILADEQLLIPALQSISDESIINVTMGYSIKDSAVFSFIKSWLDIQKELHHTKDFSLSKKTIGNFLSLTMLGFDDAFKEEITNRYNQPERDGLKEFLIQQHDFCRLFFTFQPSAHGMIDSLKELIRLVTQKQEEQNTLTLLEGNMLIRVYQEFNQLQNHLQAYESQLSTELITTLIHKIIAQISVPLEGEPLQGIQMMGMLESRCLDFEEVYILGGNDGILPYIGQSNSFIPESIRYHFGLPLKQYKDALSAYLFYRLCQRAKKIHIFYNNLVDNNSSGEVTRFVQQLQFESNIKFSMETQAPFEQGTSLKIKPLVIEKDKPVYDVLNHYLDNGNKMFSASALRKYMDCPLQFFLQYVAGIKEPDLPKEPYNAAVIGSLLHETMQIFYQPFEKTSQEVSREMIEEREPILQDICREIFVKNNINPTYLDGKTDSRYLIAEKIVLTNARNYIEHDKEIAPFEILGLEQKVTASIPLDIYGNGEKVPVNLYAIIDRVDKKDGKIRIVDYKTGKDSTLVKKWMDSMFTRKPKDANRGAFQILFYTYLYYKTRGTVAQANLYAIRSMKKEGTVIHSTDKNNPVLAEEVDSESVLKEYEEHLTELIAEIFNKDIPFAHNPDAIYCDRGSYSEFCNATEEDEEED